MNERFVAFLDVLGFREFVQNNEHAEIVKIYRNLLLTSIESAAASGRTMEVQLGQKQGVVADPSSFRVNTLIVSDSIIAYSPQATMPACIDVVAFARALLVAGFYVGLPLRGAVTVGELSALEGNVESGTGVKMVTQALVGRPLVEAVGLENRQQWSGAVVSEKALELYREFERLGANRADLATIDYLIEAGLLAQYPVPVKSSRASQAETEPTEAMTVAWPRGNRDRPSEQLVREAFGRHGKDPTAAEEKITNTIAYLNAIRPAEG